MRWLGLGAVIVAACVTAATGCGDHSEPPGLGDDTTAGGPPPAFDYHACAAPLMRDPTCEGRGCGLTDAAQEQLALMLEVVAEAGYATAFSPVEAESSPWIDALRIDYQLQVGWFRYATSVRFDVPVSEALLRQEMAGHVAGWRVPEAVASRAAIEAAVVGCHARLDYDPCTDNQPDFHVYARLDGAQPECGYETAVVIDAHDASTLACLVDEPRPCG
jgi:hypothetical protein